jgi:hypothetical protein
MTATIPAMRAINTVRIDESSLHPIGSGRLIRESSTKNCGFVADGVGVGVVGNIGLSVAIGTGIGVIIGSSDDTVATEADA